MALLPISDGAELPRFMLLDEDGRISLSMELSPRGDAQLQFASDQWNEGAVVLGHLETVDDGTQSVRKEVEDKTGAWGLEIKNRNNRSTGIGFLNSGPVISPLSGSVGKPAN